MPRHESITEEYVAQLNADFHAAAERVKSAPNWPETQERIVFGTQALLVALNRVEEGWTREEIQTELGIRTGFGNLSNPLNVVGNRTLDEDKV